AEAPDIETVETLFRRGEIKMALVLPPRFGEDLHACRSVTVQLLTDGSEPNIASLLAAYAADVLRAFQSEIAPDAPPPRIALNPRMVYNPEMRSVFLFVPGVIAVVLMLISAMLTSLSIAREKERGTLNLLLISPLPPGLIIVGKVLPYALISFLNALAIIGMGMGVFGMRMLGSWAFLLLSCLLFILTALGLGLFISTRVQTQQTAMFASLMGLMLPTVLLSGYIFPIESMPQVLQILSNVVPAKWFILLLRGIMLKGAGLGALWVPTLVLAGMALFFLLLSRKNFKLQMP
ncbi:MAG: ABC transporter permease, partial [Bacteroidetes bacterium]